MTAETTMQKFQVFELLDTWYLTTFYNYERYFKNVKIIKGARRCKKVTSLNWYKI